MSWRGREGGGGRKGGRGEGGGGGGGFEDDGDWREGDGGCHLAESKININEAGAGAGYLRADM